jgi:quinol monooxygenase YgiN
MYVVVARVKAKPGRGRDLERHLVEMAAWVASNEPETLTYLCNRSRSNSDEFVFFERYASARAFEAHAGSDTFRTLARRIADLLEGPATIEAFDEIAGKY